MSNGIYYSDYLQLDKILQAQTLESDKAGEHAHDEMLFIVIHQSYELWFKQILYEVKSVMELLSKPTISDNSPDLFIINHRLNRVVVILDVLVHQIDILETMTPLDFLDFRNRLRPASGFQSVQFKELEALLGLRMHQRYGKEYYTSQLRPEDKQRIEQIENTKSLRQLVNEWLERMPFFDEPSLWPQGWGAGAAHPFWQTYRALYASSLMPEESYNLEQFDLLVMSENASADYGMTPRARRAALFILLYRDYPLFQLPFQLINNLLEIDNTLSNWRYRHLNMVHRMIGTRTGTGGSTGKDYLFGALQSHYIFKEFAALTSFMIERGKLPALSPELCRRLGFET
ncbi:MAG: tryptophan 2,3-dioxygenase [Chitinophagales bacterium]|nr:tryptophan 2,3-dioxygenase [Chitinophagales bacterium]MDW8418102.1 tryptophan 2,3-dioxygenase family protein [Chitinophagales bacterium]